eukprot:TRINITY_DN9029_c0_g1_i1.p1 TRINITY_DN9029_c0_g1~~TRINITY_DN9029_c0_g1_i1.p1  ORF type:complete len:208 (+),score=25.61 TRINITY_DN9029_c0_g1_i1:124-747(+)
MLRSLVGSEMCIRDRLMYAGQHSCNHSYASAGGGGGGDMASFDVLGNSSNSALHVMPHRSHGPGVSVLAASNRREKLLNISSVLSSPTLHALQVPLPKRLSTSIVSPTHAADAFGDSFKPTSSQNTINNPASSGLMRHLDLSESTNSGGTPRNYAHGTGVAMVPYFDTMEASQQNTGPLITMSPTPQEWTEAETAELFNFGDFGPVA